MQQQVVPVILFFFILLHHRPFTSCSIKEFRSPVLLRNIPINKPKYNQYDTGFEADDTQMPYLVALDFKANGNTWFCVGTILGHRWILTVTSCTRPALQVMISYSAATRRSPYLTVHVTRNCFIEHPDYKRNFQNDIALIQTPHVDYSWRVQQISLPKAVDRATFDQEWVYSAGWGNHKRSASNAMRLHIVQMEVASNYNCRKFFGDRLDGNMICGKLPNMETSCRLDSGSPMILQSNPKVIGVASFGSDKGCRANVPVVYTRITEYLNWITTVMGGQ